MKTRLTLLFVAAGSVVAAADPMESLTVTSSQFTDNGKLPADMTCDGTQELPQLTWSGAPADTKSFAITVEDRDAPQGKFVHWVVTGIPVQTTAITGVPAGALAGANSGGDQGWQAPCPPAGAVHHYTFTVYALDKMVKDRDVTGPRLETAIAGHILAKGELTGTYQRMR